MKNKFFVLVVLSTLLLVSCSGTPSINSRQEYEWNFSQWTKTSVEGEEFMSEKSKRLLYELGQNISEEKGEIEVFLSAQTKNGEVVTEKDVDYFHRYNKEIFSSEENDLLTELERNIKEDLEERGEGSIDIDIDHDHPVERVSKEITLSTGETVNFELGRRSYSLKMGGVSQGIEGGGWYITGTELDGRKLRKGLEPGLTVKVPIQSLGVNADLVLEITLKSFNHSSNEATIIVKGPPMKQVRRSFD